jgi:hypothetical protein
MLSECQLPLKPPGRIAPAANDRNPPFVQDIAERRIAECLVLERGD